MKIKDQYGFTEEGVINYFSDRQGLLRQAYEMARTFSVSPEAMTVLLKRLGKEGKVEVVAGLRNVKMYGIKTVAQLELQAQMALADESAREQEFKELKGYDASLNNFRKMCEASRK